MTKPYLDFPLRIDHGGRVATTGTDDHVRDMIHQVLFTNPGERVNRPDFGCGLLQLVFMPNSDALAIATEFTVKSALQRWLGDVIQTERVTVEAVDSELRVVVVYRNLLDGTAQEATFISPAGGV
jgi:phage baseplate assembly protein W